MKRSNIIQNFLRANCVNHHKELYTPQMEVQVQVAQDDGQLERVPGSRGKRYSDGVQVWYDFRMPKGAMSKPEDNDFDLKFDFDSHVDAVGCTGWDWVNRVSKWVGYDFDSILGHKKAGLTPQQLREVYDRLKDIPWVQIQRSTSGNGYHAYVFLDDVPTDNHTEHAALGRGILGNLGALVGYDFDNKVDVCGQVLWIWSRRANSVKGFELLKKGRKLAKHEVPVNWKEHIGIVKGAGRRTKLGLVPDKEELSMEHLMGQYSHVPIDEDHRRLMDYLQQCGHVWWWDADKHMLVTHTVHLKEAHDTLGMKGVFDTDSSHSSDQNCFCFPLSKGAWVVRRHGKGVNEHKCWELDSGGWTRTYLNKPVSLDQAARLNDGLEHPTGGYHFNNAESLMKAVDSVGFQIEIPASLSTREGKVKINKDNKIVIEIPRDTRDNPKDMPGWIADKRKFIKVGGALPVDMMEKEDSIISYDDFIRHIISVNDMDAGWVVFLDESWRSEPLNHLTILLNSKGLSPNETKEVLGQCISKAWKLVNKPFEPEYLGDRQWNRDAAKLRWEIDITRSNLNYPTWNNVLNHCGKGLDTAVKEDLWCQENNILKGSDYLMYWCASLFQHPDRPLPYLFFFGDQNTGKSTFHEALELLFTKGYCYAKHSLTSQQGFNGELEGAVLCVVEEVDLSVASSTAYNRIKEWVTNKQISIRPMYKAPYLATNTTHWVQCANDPHYCPVFGDDTRITVIETYPLKPTQLIPRYELISSLEKEASDFLTELMKVELPEPKTRLNIPIITTESKTALQEQSKNSLEAFIKQECIECQGAMISFKAFYDSFIQHCDPSERGYWTKIRVSKSLPAHKHPSGASRKYSNQKYIGNIAFKGSGEMPRNYKMYVDSAGNLEQYKIEEKVNDKHD